MQHQQVIENFINTVTEGRGTFVKPDENVLFSQFPREYLPYGAYHRDPSDGRTIPLAVRLGDDNLLVNGAGFAWPISGYQSNVLRTLERSHRPFGVVPFHSIIAAWTDGEDRDWDRRTPIP